MKTILYAIQTDGLGHIMRSKPIIAYLRKYYHVLICGSSDLLKHFDQPIYELPKISWVYKKEGVSIFQTIVRLLKTNTSQAEKTLQGVYKNNNIDMLISDYEPFSIAFAHKTKKPYMVIDNIGYFHLIPQPSFNERIISKLLSLWTKKPLVYIVTTIFPTKKISGMYAVGPIVRTLPKSTNKQHILVYQTCSNNDQELIRVMQSFPKQQWIYYSHRTTGTYANVECKPIDQDVFLTDLASAKAVVCSGFTTVTECITLNKPVFIAPLNKQPEQQLNAKMIKLEGIGWSGSFDTKNLAHFIKNISKYKKAYAQKNYQFNQFETIRQTIDKTIKKKRI